jgi:hypothetical protein
MDRYREHGSAVRVAFRRCVLPVRRRLVVAGHAGGEPHPSLASAQALERDLATTDGQDRYLLAGLALGAERKGIIPNASQAYGFKIPLVLGGATNVDNIHVIDFVVSLHISGQLLRQIRDLPPGYSRLRLHDQRWLTGRARPPKAHGPAKPRRTPGHDRAHSRCRPANRYRRLCGTSTCWRASKSSTHLPAPSTTDSSGVSASWTGIPVSSRSR